MKLQTGRRNFDKKQGNILIFSIKPNNQTVYKSVHQIMWLVWIQLKN